MKPLGLGMIGVGWFGQFSLDAYAALTDLKVVAICDVDAARREAVAARFGARAFADPLELITAPDVDIVVISTAPEAHGPLSLSAARAGKHVFCEKPMAVSLNEADLVRDAVASQGVRYSIDYVLRPNPLNWKLRELLRTGILGRLHHMSLENYATDEPLKPGHWFWDLDRSGGIWIEHGVHFFDLFAWLSGEHAESVTAARQDRPDGARDRVWALVRYSGGLVATYTHAFTQPVRLEETTIRLACVRGYVELHGWIQTRIVVDALVDEAGLETLHGWAGVEPEVVARYTGAEAEGWASGAPYRAVARARVELELPQGKLAVYRESVQAGMRDLVTAIRDPSHALEVSLEDGRRSLAIAVAATRAAETGCWEPVLDV